MRCLAVASPQLEIDAREVSQPGGGDELQSPYVVQGQLDLRAWARDALALSLPTQILCKPQCAGLCAICGADLNQAGPEHVHEREPDPRGPSSRSSSSTPDAQVPPERNAGAVSGRVGSW